MNSRNKNLDILRAIAILTVFLAHTVLSFGAPSILAPLQLGGIGVDLFFVLSGFLIGSQLFGELTQHQNIEIRRFWLRRWMRTLPAYYSVLALTILQQYLTKEDFSFPWQYLIFLQNYGDGLPIFAVSWSLSVEEQFYLIIAPTILLLSKLKSSRRIIVLFTLLLLPSLFRHLDLYGSLYETHVRIDCCIMGIILADIKTNQMEAWKRLQNICKLLGLISLTLFFSFFWNRWYPLPLIEDPSPFYLALVFGVWVVNSHGNSWLSGFRLDSVIYYISSRSYAIYLLHPDALVVTKRLIPKDNFIIYFCFALLLSIILSEFLYRLIELPFMRLRSKFKISAQRL